MATIEFKDYIIDKMQYQENDNYDHESDSLDVGVEFSASVAYEKNKGIVILMVALGDESNVQCPFTVYTSIKGIFEYELENEEEESEKDDLRELMSTNAIAILYPYLRSVVSDITLRANNYPVFVLPVVNVVEDRKSVV